VLLGRSKASHVLVPRRLFLLRPDQLWREVLRRTDYNRTPLSGAGVQPYCFGWLGRGGAIRSAACAAA